MTLQAFFDQKEHGSFINGEFRKKGQSVDLVSPVTGEVWKQFCPVNRSDVEEAITSAHRTFYAWKQVPSPVRAKMLRGIGDLIVAHRDLFAHSMAMEMGKPIREGVLEADYAAGYFYWFAAEAERMYGQTIPSQFEDKTLLIRPEPLGVCGIITPWNYPVAVPARKIAPALAAGCTVVCKPSPECPMTLLLLAQAASIVGLPAGALNIVVGDEKEIGTAILESAHVRKLSFTGSTQVGKYLYEKSAPTLKKLTLELGGHAPILIFDDADLEKAVAGAVAAKFRNNGQTCVCPNRFFVQSGIYDAFFEKFKDAVKALRVGSPLEEETELSEVLHPTSVEKVRNHIDDALEKGAQAELMGQEVCFPTILSGITPDMIISQEETFGPVASLMRFETDEEVITLANASEYGLAAYVFTENLSRAHCMIQSLEYGIIGLNDGLPSTPQAPFGGIKSSGFGREGGRSGLHEYFSEKYISMKF